MHSNGSQEVSLLTESKDSNYKTRQVTSGTRRLFNFILGFQRVCFFMVFAYIIICLTSKNILTRKVK